MSNQKNKINLIDLGVVAAFGMYVNSRINGGKDDSFVRTIAGLGFGGLVAAKGPEIVDTFKQVILEPKYDPLRESAVYGLVGGTTTVLFKDAIKEVYNKMVGKP